MNAPARRSGATLRTSLSLLRDQLHVVVPALTVGEGHPQMAQLLARLRTTAAGMTDLLAAAEPAAQAAIGAGLEHAAAGEYNESRTEFLTAYRRLSILLHDHPDRRASAVGESTQRWRPVR
ncbi:MAG: hypothetical protein GEV04_05655 [Actinophytocola sp.]|nr:hypothetical protein [Actinophytocola sp.]